jgi:hypothetical protein
MFWLIAPLPILFHLFFRLRRQVQEFLASVDQPAESISAR